MKKIDLGQAFTILANVGVIIGIVFLAIEIRHASDATRLQTIESVSAGWFQLNDAIVRDPQVARVWVVGLYNPSALSDTEAIQFSMYLRMFTNQVRRVVQHHDLGLVPDIEFQTALRQLATIIETPGGRLFREGEPFFDLEFADRLRPYMGQERTFDLMLGRDTSALK
jgi:hypothetical protein